MGNVRNPVGPLPSSIYWRRRAIVACLFAIVVALVVWVAVPHGGSSSDSAKGRGPSGSPAPGGGGRHRTPLPSITPGPTTSQTGITTEPGGRDDGGTGDGGGSANGGTGDGGSDAGTASGGSSVGESPLPDGTSVPDCSGSGVTLSLRSVRSSYQPGRKPEFAVTAVNSGGSACKVNFSGASTVVTVRDSGGHHIWSTGDCPADRSPYLLAVPAGGSTIDDVTWNLAVSAPDCATPSGSRTVSSGTYRAEVAVPGLGSAHTSFVLDQT